MAAITDLIIHAPWWISLVGLAAGLPLFLLGKSKQDNTLKKVALAIVLIGILLAAIGFVFPSDLQKMVKRTKDIATAVDTKNWTNLQSLLDHSTSIGTASTSMQAGDKQIVALAKANAEGLNIGKIAVSNVEGKQTGSLITVSMDITCTINLDAAMGRPVQTSWQFDYQQSGNTWVLQKITWLRMDGQNPDQLLNMVKQPKF